MISKQKQLHKRHKRVRAKISGTAMRPRLSVARSNRYVYAQLIDDSAGCTIVGVLQAKKKSFPKQDAARETGRELSRRAREQGITVVAFDRGGYRYHGRVKSLADGAREGGLKF